MVGVSDWDRWGKKKAYLTSVSIYTQLVEKEERDSTFSLTFCSNLVQAEKTTVGIRCGKLALYFYKAFC